MLPHSYQAKRPAILKFPLAIMKRLESVTFVHLREGLPKIMYPLPLTAKGFKLVYEILGRGVYVYSYVASCNLVSFNRVNCKLSGSTRNVYCFSADVDGSLEALQMVLDSYNCDHQISLSVVSADVGTITEKDLELAETTQGNTLETDAIWDPHIPKMNVPEKCLQLSWHKGI